MKPNHHFNFLSIFFFNLIIFLFLFNELKAQKKILLDSTNYINLSSNQQQNIFNYITTYQCSYFLGIIDSNNNILDIDMIKNKFILENNAEFRLNCEGVIKKIIDSTASLNFIHTTIKNYFIDNDILSRLENDKTKYTYIFLTTENVPKFFKKSIIKWGNHILRNNNDCSVKILKL